jgi:two-component system chemotaxis sensor kinase CheA
MKIDLSQFRETFLQESADHMATIESELLALRSRPADTEILNTIFRSAHSIKGGAGSFGMENLVRFTHGLESLLDRLRNGEIEAGEAIIAVLLGSVDVLRALLNPASEDVMPDAAESLLASMSELCQAGSAQPAPVAEPHGEAPRTGPELAFYRVEFEPDRGMFESATNPLVLLRNLAQLGTVSSVELGADALPALAELEPAQCYLSWVVEMATMSPVAELQEVFEFVEHLAEIRIVRLDQAAPSTGRASPPSAAASSSMLSGSAPQSRVAAAPAKQAARPAGEASSIRVATEKVDRLIDLVGELVIAHAMTAQLVKSFTPDNLPRLRHTVSALERDTRELHERVMAIRMLPVGSLFQRYVRTVYDISQATGKQIELQMSGEDTEIDKSMLESLADPLTHLIRNAADHGIEMPEARTAQGKPAVGTIWLRAFHRSGRVIIEIADDGAGIDPARIRAKAIERGIIAPDAQLSDSQLRMLVFHAGFSTRDQVSAYSGRGVGMDVVRQNVQQLNGVISLKSETGEGSSVTLELPLTLAVIEGLLVRVADRTLVLPLLAVVETVAPRPQQIQRIAEKGEVVVVRDQAIPLLRLSRFLGQLPGKAALPSDAESSDRSLIVVVETGRCKIGLWVDALLGQQQIVIKSLERHLRKVDGLMGATILGDGSVAPILDVAGLAELPLFAIGDA